MSDTIALEMFCNTKYLRRAIDGYAPAILNLVVYWPAHIIELAIDVRDGGPTYPLCDALLELGLSKTAEMIKKEGLLPYDGFSSRFLAHLIAKSANPNWWATGPGYVFNDNERIIYYEQQAEMEEYWIRMTGITPVENDHAVKWCLSK